MHSAIPFVLDLTTISIGQLKVAFFAVLKLVAGYGRYLILDVGESRLSISAGTTDVYQSALDEKPAQPNKVVCRDGRPYLTLERTRSR